MMSNRRSGVSIAFAIVSMLLAAQASGQSFGRGGGEFTPEPDARDLKSVLFNWTWHMGMLRGQSEVELIATLEYRAEGNVQINGQACRLDAYEDAEPGVLGTAGYRISANYRLPGYRTHISCTLPDGERYSNIETLSDVYAWDEDIPGAEIVPGEGTASPNKAAYEERLIRLWASPHGAPKAAMAAAGGVSLAEAFTENPARLLERQEAEGSRSEATLEWQRDKAIISYPIPGVEDALATVTLSPEFLPELVEVRHGDDRYEFTYGEYGDFNNPLHRIEAYFPGVIVERKNGELVRGLRTVMTEIGQVYVQVPVPSSVIAAGPAAD